MRKPDERQLSLNFETQAPKLKVIRGLGQRRPDERLKSRDAVARVLVEAGADLLLRRISVERAEVIEREVDEILALFDAIDRHPALMPKLEQRLDGLEGLMRETRQARPARRKTP